MIINFINIQYSHAPVYIYIYNMLSTFSKKVLAQSLIMLSVQHA